MSEISSDVEEVTPKATFRPPASWLHELCYYGTVHGFMSNTHYGNQTLGYKNK